MLRNVVRKRMMLWALPLAVIVLIFAIFIVTVLSGVGGILGGGGGGGGTPIGTAGSGNYDIRYGQISLDKINQILQEYPLYPLGGDGLPIGGASPSGPNPLTPYAQSFLDFGQQYNINPAYTLAWFIRESGLCTTGISPTAIECGNIVWTAGGGCATHNYITGPDGITRDFCGYASWPDAIEAWFKLMTSYYLPQGWTTVHDIVSHYAPCSDNGGGNAQDCTWTDDYINTVETLVSGWGAEYSPAPEPGSGDGSPAGSPMPKAYITQPFGCTDLVFEPVINGCHFHQGIDLSPDNSVGHPEYSTITGTVLYAGIDPYTQSCGPSCGLGIMVKLQSADGHWILKYGHMEQTEVETGQTVTPGQVVGLEGNTGASTGPHLHYQLEKDGQLVDPFPTLLGQNGSE